MPRCFFESIRVSTMPERPKLYCLEGIHREIVRNRVPEERAREFFDKLGDGVKALEGGKRYVSLEAAWSYLASLDDNLITERHRQYVEDQLAFSQEFGMPLMLARYDFMTNDDVTRLPRHLERVDQLDKIDNYLMKREKRRLEVEHIELTNKKLRLEVAKLEKEIAPAVFTSARATGSSDDDVDSFTSSDGF
jgi:hypothetical protein